MDKLQYSFTSPWKVITSLPGGSYKLEHCLNPRRRDKKHASALSPYPLELIPFQPINGADNCYGQLNKIIGEHPFKEAGLKGFAPSTPFVVPANFAQCGDYRDSHWPTLAKLNDLFPWLNDEEKRLIFNSEGDAIIQEPVLYNGPPPSSAEYQSPRVPPVSSLVASIIKSHDRLFFIAYSYTNPTTREWRLVRVAFDESTALSLLCLQDCRFLVEFFTLYHEDIRYNMTNQRFWLQYHKSGDIATPTPFAATHLIRPSETSKASRSGSIPTLDKSHTQQHFHSRTIQLCYCWGLQNTQPNQSTRLGCPLKTSAPL